MGYKRKHKVQFIGENVYVDEKLIEQWKEGCRLIYDLGDEVLKVDNIHVDENLSFQCEDEYSVWNDVKKTKYKKYFVPIIEHGRTNRVGYYYNIQPKINISGKPISGKHKKILDEIRFVFGIDDLCMNNGNCTEDENENLLIYDYAI